MELPQSNTKRLPAAPFSFIFSGGAAGFMAVSRKTRSTFFFSSIGEKSREKMVPHQATYRRERYGPHVKQPGKKRVKHVLVEVRNQDFRSLIVVYRGSYAPHIS